MNPIVDDELVEMVAKAINGAPFATARSRAKARAALAVAVPVIGERCAALAAEVGEEQSGKFGQLAAGIRMGASSCVLRIRSLTKVQP